MQRQKKKGVVCIKEGEKTLFYDIYEGKDEGTFYMVRSETDNHQLKSLEVFPGRWVRFEKEKEAAHLEALRQEDLQTAVLRGLTRPVL